MRASGLRRSPHTPEAFGGSNVPEIKHQQPSDSPEISFAEIHIPDDEDLGTGTFTTTFVPSVLPPVKAIGLMVKSPTFQISVTVNPNLNVNVNLGLADGTRPKDSGSFFLPKEIEPSIAPVLTIRFAKWCIVSATLDGDPLTSLETIH